MSTPQWVLASIVAWVVTQVIVIPTMQVFFHLSTLLDRI